MNKAESQATARSAGSFHIEDAQSDNVILSTPPLSPSVVRALHSLNIRTLADVKALGAPHCFALLKASGLTITKSVLWQLGALVWHTNAQQLSPEQKQDLQAAYQALPPVHLAPSSAEQHTYMQAALEQAQAAALQGEIPIGQWWFTKAKSLPAPTMNVCNNTLSVPTQKCWHYSAQAQCYKATAYRNAMSTSR